MSKFDKIVVPAGDKITADANGKLQVSDRPIVAFIEGDGTGPDITKASMHILEYFCGIVIVSLVCTLATAPLVAYHFHTIPLLSVLANLLVCLLASVLLYAVALWWILFWWNGARLLLTEVLETIARLMNTVAEWISSVSWATLNWSPSKIQVLLSYALIVSAATYLYRRTATSLKLTLIILVVLLATFL